MEPIIHVENLSKVYRIGVAEEQPTSLSQSIARTLQSPFSYLARTLRPATEEETLWALRGISFDVQQSEIVGVVGHNGAGKSTLLKILSRLTDPTEGRAVLRGRVGSLLEVGTGFHPELTGRENIYMSGTILGMKKREIDSKLEEIVEFAEISKFLDMPVKRYSSGMNVRLGFAVAAHLEPEILIVDEVLSVGDTAFQKKCLRKIESVAQDGRTVLVVSHNLFTISRLASRAIWLEHGVIRTDGACDDVVVEYLSNMASRDHSVPRSFDGADEVLQHGLIVDTDRDYGLTVERILLRNERGQATYEFAPGEPMTVEIYYDAHIRIPGPYIWISVDSKLGPAFAANMLLDGQNPDELYGRGVLACTFDSLPLLPQLYTLRMAMRSDDTRTAIIPPQEVAFLRVRSDLRTYGYEAPGLESRLANSVPLVVPYSWTMPDGKRHSVSLQRARV